MMIRRVYRGRDFGNDSLKDILSTRPNVPRFFNKQITQINFHMCANNELHENGLLKFTNLICANCAHEFKYKRKM